METLLAIVDQYPYLGLFLLLMFGGVGVPVPEDATLILAGFLVSQDVIRPLPALLVIYPGLLIADSFLYLFGRRFGSMIVTPRRFQRILPAERFAELEERFKSSGSLLILFGRHVAGLRVQLFLAAGIMRMPFRKFIIADAFSAVFTIALMGGIGYSGGNSLQIIRKDMSRIEHVGVVIVLTALTLYLLYRYFRSRGGPASGGGATTGR